MGNRWSQKEAVFRAAIREAREVAGLTQAEVASSLGKPQSFISKVESGERQLYFLEARDLCRAYNIDWVEFVNRLEQRLATKPR